MYKRFLLNSGKKIAQINLVVFEGKRTPILKKNDVTEPKAKLLQ